MNLGSDTVTVLRGQSRDRLGDVTGSDTSTDVAGCMVQPTAATESTDNGEMLVTNVTLFAPAGTDVLATDRVRWLDSVYEVDGQPSRPRDQSANESHVQVQLKLVQGQG